MIEAVKCHLNAPLMLLAFKNNHDAAVPAAAGKVIELLGPDQADYRFVVVSVDGEEFHAFADDVRERCTPIPARPALLASPGRHPFPPLMLRAAS